MLENIRSPRDIKGLSLDELGALAAELRGELIDTVLKNGGHLASNLGAVELTLALHYVFDAPRDKLIFDVGHQAYVHKMLTGRAGAFSMLRKRGGLSGFPSIFESEYDDFGGGHASTAISAALGFARARDLRGGDEHVVAVVGDGAFTGGMCYEAMDDAGQSGTRLIVVLNDNEMSISKNVGALAAHLTDMRQSGFYLRTKRALKRGTLRHPQLYALLKRLKSSAKRMLVGDGLFEALGFEYLGPIDGHDIKRLVKVLSRAQNSPNPVLLHVVTKKGRGYAPAEASPDRYHGVSPADAVATGDVSSGAAACAELIARAGEDERIVALTAAMPLGTCAQAFKDAYPNRFFDVGIAEEHMVTLAAGMARAGLRPFVFVYSTFLQRAYDQLAEDVCLQKLPVTLLVDRAGFVGEDGATHHGLFDISFMRQLPNMTVAAPCDAARLRALIGMSLDRSEPFAIRYPRALPERLVTGALEYARWSTLREGSDAALLATGAMVREALEAAESLAREGVICRVVAAEFVKPLDIALLRQLAKLPLLVTVEENVRAGGFGSAVMEALSDMGARQNVLALGAPDRFVPQGARAEQLEECALTPERMAEAILCQIRH